MSFSFSSVVSNVTSVVSNFSRRNALQSSIAKLKQIIVVVEIKYTAQREDVQEAFALKKGRTRWWESQIVIFIDHFIVHIDIRDNNSSSCIYGTM